MARLDRRARLSGTDFTTLGNTAGATDEVVAGLVVRPGRGRGWAVVAGGVALRRGGNEPKPLFPRARVTHG